MTHPQQTTPSAIGEALVKLIPTAEELRAPQVEPAPSQEQALQRLSDLGQELQPGEFVAAPSTAGERAEVIENLLMYAGDNGYSHIDYADTMRHAAALLQSTAMPDVEPVAWPQNALEIREFIGSNFNSRTEDGEPSDDDEYSLTAHDLLSAFSEWVEFVRPVALPVGEHVNCACGDSYPADSFGAGFIAAAGHCENCAAAASLQPVREPLPEWVLVHRRGLVPLRKGPFHDSAFTAKMLRELYELYPDCICSVIEAPNETWPESGVEYLQRFDIDHGITKKGGE